MPEGDVVWRTAQRLHAALAGRAVIRSDLRWPSLATADLTGRTVTAVVARGKHILIRLGPLQDSDEGSGGLTLHSHLRMEGSWRVDRTDQPRRRESHDVRAVLANAEWTVTGSRLGMLDLVPTSEERTLVGHLGPDILGVDWDLAQVLANLRTEPARAVGDALLDQRVIAGIGTFYLAETLFLVGRTPWTPVAELSEPERQRVVERAHRLLHLNRDRVVQVTTGLARPGQECFVHGRSGLPCRRCGTTVRVAMLGSPPRDRTAFYCPSCQAGPAPTDDGRPQRPLGSRS